MRVAESESSPSERSVHSRKGKPLIITNQISRLRTTVELVYISSCPQNADGAVFSTIVFFRFPPLRGMNGTGLIPVLRLYLRRAFCTKFSAFSISFIQIS